MATHPKGKVDPSLHKKRKAPKCKALPKKSEVASKEEAAAFNEGMDPEPPKVVKVGKAGAGGKGKGTAKAKAKAAKPPKAEKAPRVKKERASKPKADGKLSMLGAAEIILKGAPAEGLQCATMVNLMGEKGLWAPGTGKTPAATLSAAIIKNIAAKKGESKFVKVSPGFYALNA